MTILSTILALLLAKLGVTQPTVLVLDEPTNHLDLEAVLWFEDFIARYEGDGMPVLGEAFIRVKLA